MGPDDSGRGRRPEHCRTRLGNYSRKTLSLSTKNPQEVYNPNTLKTLIPKNPKNLRTLKTLLNPFGSTGPFAGRAACVSNLGLDTNTRHP
eukprot:5687022-Pyramimonas_sp.AAC.1